MKTKLLILFLLVWMSGCGSSDHPIDNTTEVSAISVAKPSPQTPVMEISLSENATKKLAEQEKIIVKPINISSMIGVISLLLLDDSKQSSTIPTGNNVVNPTLPPNQEPVVDENKTQEPTSTPVDENVTQTPTEENTTQEHLTDDKKLFVDDNGTQPSTEPEPEPEKPLSSQWYMRTVISATAADGTVYTHDKAGVFGELGESSDGYDKHDVPVFGTAILQVVFPQTNWGANNSDYASDYHSVKEAGEREVWTFQIKNQRDVNLVNAPITLSLEGPYDVSSTEQDGSIVYTEALSENMSRKTSITLVDVDNQTQYTYDQLQSATLSMGSLHTRTFRWVMGEVDGDDYAPIAAVALAEKPKAERVDGLGGKFGLPPQ